MYIHQTHTPSMTTTCTCLFSLSMCREKRKTDIHEDLKLQRFIHAYTYQPGLMFCQRMCLSEFPVSLSMSADLSTHFDHTHMSLCMLHTYECLCLSLSSAFSRSAEGSMLFFPLLFRAFPSSRSSWLLWGIWTSTISRRSSKSCMGCVKNNSLSRGTTTSGSETSSLSYVPRVPRSERNLMLTRKCSS